MRDFQWESYIVTTMYLDQLRAWYEIRRNNIVIAMNLCAHRSTQQWILLALTYSLHRKQNKTRGNLFRLTYNNSWFPLFSVKNQLLFKFNTLNYLTPFITHFLVARGAWPLSRFFNVVRVAVNYFILARDFELVAPWRATANYFISARFRVIVPWLTL